MESQGQSITVDLRNLEGAPMVFLAPDSEGFVHGGETPYRALEKAREASEH